MSAENPFLKPPAEGSAVPASSLTDVVNAVSALLQEQRRFDRQTVTKFKKLFGDAGLRWWIIAAGVGGAVELVRLLGDVGRFLWSHYR